MKHYSRTLIYSGLAALLSTSALAAIDNVRNMKDGTPITVSGKIDNVHNEREFVLRDKTGIINVTVKSDQSVVLKPGDNVTVSGTVDKYFFGTDIDASSVTVNKNVARAVGDAIESNTSLSLEGATAYKISSLPKEGLVKVSGTVTNIANEKKFTVKDTTGSIKVNVKSPETAVLTKGAKVTVIGYVDNGMFSKNISANKVLVVANAATASQ